MKKYMNKHRVKKKDSTSLRLLLSYLLVILAPAVAIVVIYITMQNALLDIQKEKSQNLSKEAVLTFNSEIDQLANIGRYISNDMNLKEYMDNRSDFHAAENYYKTYELAKSYPNYALLNRFVKSICILPEGNQYIIRIPQVIPSNLRGISTLEMAGAGEYYDVLLKKLYELGPTGLVYNSNNNGTNNFLILQELDFGGQGKKGIVAIEVDKSQIKNLLRSALGEDEGTAFLVDNDNNILYGYDQKKGVVDNKDGSVSWEKYIEEICGESIEADKLIIRQFVTEYNGWSIVTVIPRAELLSKIGNIKYAIPFLCVAALMIGVAVCLWNWNNSRPVVAKYVKYTERYPAEIIPEKQKNSIWKILGTALEHLEMLQLTVEKQKQWACEGIIRKLLYGSYEAEEELENEVLGAEVDFPVRLPCYIVGLDMESPVGQELTIGMEELETSLRENLDLYLKNPYWLCRMGTLSYTVIISTVSQDIDGEKLKQLFERMNYALYSQIPVNIYTGISNLADTVQSISEEYEHVCRICGYARYYKLRVPLLISELPRHQHVIFTVELEMQFEKTIKNGSLEQMKKIMGQTMENYLKACRGGYKSAEHNLEVLRCIVLRCLDGEEASERVEQITERVHRAKNAEELEKGIFCTWNYFAEKRAVGEDKDEEVLKKQIEEKIEQEYSHEDFNLAGLADWMDIPEKKLYRDFKKMFGVSFSSYLEVLRIRYAQEYLKEGRTVQDVASAVGYSSDYSFRRAFKRVVGTAPSDYQKMYL